MFKAEFVRNNGKNNPRKLDRARFFKENEIQNNFLKAMYKKEIEKSKQNGNGK